MKILSEGKIPFYQLRTLSCKYCGCSFECCIREMMRRPENDDENGPVYSIACPTCGTDVWSN